MSVRQILSLLHATDRPDIEAVFLKLANIKLYKAMAISVTHSHRLSCFEGAL